MGWGDSCRFTQAQVERGRNFHREHMMLRRNEVVTTKSRGRLLVLAVFAITTLVWSTSAVAQDVSLSTGGPRHRMVVSACRTVAALPDSTRASTSGTLEKRPDLALLPHERCLGSLIAYGC